MQTLSRAHNRLLRLTPSWSTKAWWKQAKQTKKQVIIPLLFLLIFLPKYQTLYYILVFGGRTGRKRLLPDDCPTAEHGTESFLDATEGQWARNLVGGSESRSHVKWAPVFQRPLQHICIWYHTHFLPKIRCTKTRLNTFQRHFKKFALENPSECIWRFWCPPPKSKRKTYGLGL